MGLPVTSRELRFFKEIMAPTPLSAKVYFPGRHAIPARVRLVTTFYPYLQLTPGRVAMLGVCTGPGDWQARPEVDLFNSRGQAARIVTSPGHGPGRASKG
jgi:hypothetical protein